MYEYFITEDPLRPNSAHMFAKGIVLYTKPDSETLPKLIKKAKEIIITPLPSMSETEIELAKYDLDDIFKDLEDLILEKNEIAIQTSAGELFKYCIDLFFQIDRSIIEKNKRILNQISNMDKKFFIIIQNVVNSHFHIINMKKLIFFFETLLKGPRTKEWKLKSSLNIKRID